MIATGGLLMYYGKNISKNVDRLSDVKCPDGKSGIKKTSENFETVERKKPGNMQKQVEKNQAPKSARRVDQGRRSHEKDHVHFEDGSALNVDGTWKHGNRKLTKAEVEWLLKNGWKPS